LTNTLWSTVRSLPVSVSVSPLPKLRQDNDSTIDCGCTEVVVVVCAAANIDARSSTTRSFIEYLHADI
jgi:hypothetical protein